MGPTCSLARRNALRGSGGRVLGGVLQPLDHLPLDGGADGGVRRVPQVLGGAFQSVLVKFGIGLVRY